MIKTNLFLIEVVDNNYLFIEKLINDIRERIHDQEWNNIIIFKADFDIPRFIYDKFDRIYKNSSTNSLFQIIKKNDFYFDNLIHIISVCEININYVFYLLKKRPKFYVSNDNLGIICRTYTKLHLKKVDKLTKTSYRRFLINNKAKVINRFINNKVNDELYSIISKNLSKNIYSKKILKNKIIDYGLVSIIMTCFNSENTIEYSLISIMNQTYPNKEIIIIDDCSNDNTVSIIKNLIRNKQNIRLLINKENKGCYHSKNIGIKTMNTESK